MLKRFRISDILFHEWIYHYKSYVCLIKYLMVDKVYIVCHLNATLLSCSALHRAGVI